MPRSLVRNFMSSLTISLSPETRIDDAENLLWESQLSDVYVVNTEGSLIGVVPDYDFLKWRSINLCGTGRLSAIMSPVSIALSIDDPIEKAVSLLCKNIHSRVPVVDQKKLVGAVDRRCIARGLNNLQPHIDPSCRFLEGNLNHGAIAAPKFLQTGNFSRSKDAGSQKFPSS